MAKLGINTGTIPNDNTGDSLILGAVKINSNFDEIYTYLGAGTTDTLLSPTWGSTSVGISTIRNIGIGTTNPTSTLTVDGNVIISGVVTASTFIGTVSNASYSDSSGISSFSSIAGSATTATRVSIAETTVGSNSILLSSGASLGDNDLYIDSSLTYNASTNTLTVGTLVGSVSYASISGISTLSNYSSLSGISSYSDISGISTYSNTSGISSYSDVSGISTTSQGLTGTPNINVGVTTSSSLDVGFDGSIIRTTLSGFVGVGSNTPSNFVQVGSENQFVSVVSHNAPLIGINTNIIGIDTSSVTLGLEIDAVPNIIATGTTVVSIGLTEVGISTSTINLIDFSNTELSFGYRDNTRHVSITSQGNVGLGTTIPSSKLTVVGGDISVGIGTSHGLLLTSPNGTQYRLIVDDSGNLSTVSI